MNLAKAKNVEQDLSMEEILASIRRIIAEDQAVENSPVPQKNSHVPTKEQRYAEQDTFPEDIPSVMVGSNFPTSVENENPGMEESWLMENAPQTAAIPTPLPRSVPTALQQHVKPPVFPHSAEQESVSDSETTVSPPMPPRIDTLASNTGTVPPSSTPAPSLDKAAMQLSSLLSKQTDDAIANSFNKLSRVSASPSLQQVSVDEFLKQMLRPMLKEWLDVNLPRVVERLIQAEIERALRSGNMRIGG